MLNQRILEEMSKVMENQFVTNMNKNIFCNTNQLSFDKDTLSSLSKLRKYIHLLSKEQIDFMAYNYQHQFLDQFYKVNQYLYFNKSSKQYIRSLYLTLLNELKDLTQPVDEIEDRHYQRISTFIKNSNPSVYQMNHNNKKIAQQFVCAQYSGEFLCNLLKLSQLKIKGPVLDIGCGLHGNLVTYLQKLNIEAYGIDRETSANECSSIDWFVFDYGSNQWNTIISNLSFTSHFLYHHLQNEEIANQYASTYMKILDSLTKNGQWIYAPSIDFFEGLLPKERYQIERTPIHKDFSKTVITKL